MARRRLGHWAKQVFMAVTCALFSAFGIAMLAVGSGGDRLWGLIVVLMFGVGGVMYFLLPRFTRGGREGVRLGTAKFRGATRPAIVFPQSWGKRRVALVGTTAFTLSASSWPSPPTPSPTRTKARPNFSSSASCAPSFSAS